MNNGLDSSYNIELNLEVEAVQIIGDEKLLLRAINNLVQNSISHNPQGCQIILESSLSKDHSHYRFIVKDNGRGISQEQLKGITELPYSSTRKGAVRQGHGLGLPMVARIVKVHHGRFLLENHEEKGGLKATMEFLVSPQNDKG